MCRAGFACGQPATTLQPVECRVAQALLLLLALCSSLCGRRGAQPHMCCAHSLCYAQSQSLGSFAAQHAASRQEACDQHAASGSLGCRSGSGSSNSNKSCKQKAAESCCQDGYHQSAWKTPMPGRCVCTPNNSTSSAGWASKLGVQIMELWC